MTQQKSAAVRARPACVLMGACLALAACQTPPPPPPPPSIAALLEQPAERALAAGLVEYDDGAFDRAQANFETAVRQRLRDPHDAAVAHKHLAFIACAFNRPADCETQFQAAFTSDPDFRLSDAEIGHPIWGPVYRRVAAARAASQKKQSETQAATPPR